MKKETITINLDKSLEATLAAMLVQLASKHDSKIYLGSVDGAVKVNGKSIMGMMSLSLVNGADVLVEADGADEDAAIEELKNYLTGKSK